MERAASILTRAADLDKAHRYSESLICYQEGIQLLLDALKGTYVGQHNYLIIMVRGRFRMRTSARS